jgi:hypothetical protein
MEMRSSSHPYYWIDSTKTVGDDGWLDPLYSTDFRRLTHPTTTAFSGDERWGFFFEVY